MREIKLLIRIDEKKNAIGVIDNLSRLGILKGIDRTIFLMGIYSYLLNRETRIFENKVRVEK